MKIFFLLTCLLVLTVTSYSQQNSNPHHLDYDHYMTKHKNQKTVAGILLIGGIGMMGIGTLIITGQGVLTADESDTILPAVGLVSSLCSIPFFIISGTNKRRAASISLGNQQLFLPQNNTFVLKTQPALTLKVGF